VGWFRQTQISLDFWERSEYREALQNAFALAKQLKGEKVDLSKIKQEKRTPTGLPDYW